MTEVTCPDCGWNGETEVDTDGSWYCPSVECERTYIDVRKVTS